MLVREKRKVSKYVLQQKDKRKRALVAPINKRMYIWLAQQPGLDQLLSFYILALWYSKHLAWIDLIRMCQHRLIGFEYFRVFHWITILSLSYL